MKNLYTGCLIVILIIVSCARVPSSGRMIPHGKEFDSLEFQYYFVEAIKQKLFGNPSDAMRLLDQCLKINPGSDAANFQMAQILSATGNETESRKYVKKANELDDNNIWYMMMLASSYYKENKADSAILYYEMAARKFPERRDLYITLAGLHSEKGNFGRAADIFDALDKKYGVNEASTLGSVKNFMWAGKFDDAEKKIRLLLEQKPDEILYNGLLAEIYRGQGNKEAAVDVYNSLIENHPDNPEIILSLADFLIAEKEYEELFKIINVIIINENISREDKIALFARLIELPDIAENYGSKLHISLRVLEASYSNDDIVVLLRPEFFIAQKNYDDALLRFEEIISRNPANYYAWEKLMLTYLDIGDFKSLENRAAECATKFNRSFLAKAIYSTALAENKKYAAAIEELRKAEILAGNDNDMLLQVYSLKADIYYKMGDLENSFKTFDTALGISNNDNTVLNNYAYYLAESGLRLREAEEMSKKVIKEETENKTFLDTYAWVLYKRGKKRAAEEVMKNIIIELGGDDAEYFEHYGFILESMKRCDDAVIFWQKAIESDSTKKHLETEINRCLAN